MAWNSSMVSRTTPLFTMKARRYATRLLFGTFLDCSTASQTTPVARGTSALLAPWRRIVFTSPFAAATTPATTCAASSHRGPAAPATSTTASAATSSSLRSPNSSHMEVTAAAPGYGGLALRTSTSFVAPSETAFAATDPISRSALRRASTSRGRVARSQEQVRPEP